jgi:alkylation response protein AidB-like acyl-CoA dehydrogenase
MFDKIRLKSKTNTQWLANHVLYDNPTRFASLQALWKRIENDPEFDKKGRNDLGHTSRYTDACRKVVRFSELIAELCLERGCKELTLDEMYDVYIGVDENIPLDVHMSMFIPLMRYHTSQQQRDEWLADALKFRIIGAYAQTELAHGSNVKGIETIATYHPPKDNSSDGVDEKDDDGYFVIHSPCLSSLKWWPGGLGHTCTHAVVYAQLYINDKSYGINSFLIQLRDLYTHQPLKGIECGDIGPKVGYNSMDNGYAKFTNVIIPRKNMLAGYAQVNKNGIYTKQSGSEKVAYGIMLDVRVRICANSAMLLARAVTIAIRYSLVRKQGGSTGTGTGTDASSEIAVMEYPTQQRLILPCLALSYGIHFLGKTLRKEYDEYTYSIYLHDHDLLSDFDSNSNSRSKANANANANTSNENQNIALTKLLPILHTRSASFKAFITQNVHESMERCRKACGGHGFLSNAGFSELMTSYLPMCTLEGTREVLGQQAGRALLKMRMNQISFELSLPTGSNNSSSSSSSSSIDSNAFISLCNDILRPNQTTPIDMRCNVNSLVQLVNIMFCRCCHKVDHAHTIVVNKLTDLMLHVHVHVQGEGTSTKTSILSKLTGIFNSNGNKDNNSNSENENENEKDLLYRNKKKQAFQTALTFASSELVEVSEAYCEYSMIHAFYQALHKMSVFEGEDKNESGIENEQCDNETLASLQRLFLLLCLSFINKSQGDFFSINILKNSNNNYFSSSNSNSNSSSSSISISSSVSLLNAAISSLCTSIKDDSLNLIEAWYLSDKRLDSTLGKSDGNYMEALYNAAKIEPLNIYANNNNGVSEGYRLHLHKILRDRDQHFRPIAKSKL